MNDGLTNCSLHDRFDDEYVLLDGIPASTFYGHTFVNRDFLIIYVSQDSMTCSLNSKSCYFRPGSLIMVPPGHNLELYEAGKDSIIYGASLSSEFLHEVDLRSCLRIAGEGNIASIFWCPSFSDIFIGYARLCKIILSKNERNAVWQDLIITTTGFFHKIGRVMMEDEQGHVSKIFPELTSSFLKLVDENFRTHHDIKWYSEMLCKSPKYFSRLIKAESGRNASWWIEKKLSEEAGYLLLSSSLSMSQISDRLGFTSESFFGKYFKRLNGCSPMQYRKTHMSSSYEKNGKESIHQ